MTCEGIEGQLSALIDGDLDPKTKAAVQEHLQGCPDCRELLEDLQQIVRASQELPPISPPDWLYAAIRHQVHGQQTHRRAIIGRLGWVLIPAVATIVLLFVFMPRKQEVLPVESQPVVIEQAPPTPVPPLPVAQPSAPRKKMVRPAIRTSKVQPTTVSTPTVQTPVRPDDEHVPTDALVSLREIQQALEEIEAALQQNPGNAYVVRAYQLTYQKGVELRDAYLAGTR